MPKKPAHKPRPSVPPAVSSIPTAPSSSLPKSSILKPSTKSSTAAAKSSTHAAFATCQRTTGISSASGSAPSASASALNESTNAQRMKTKQPADEVVAGDETDEEELINIIRDRAERSAAAKGSTVPLILDPKVILEFIDIWCKDPKTPLDDLNLPPGPKHMLTSYILNEKYRIDQAKQVRKAQYKKEHELKRKMLTITPDELLALQTEIQQLEEKFQNEANVCRGAKERLTAQVMKITEDYNKRPPLVAPQNPQASSSAAPPEETEKADETARIEENLQPEELPTAPASSPVQKPAISAATPPSSSSRLKKSTLPSASEVKKTKAAEKEALRKRKSSDPPAQSVKKLRTDTVASVEPIYVEPLATAPPSAEVTDRRLIPFSEGRDDEENLAATSEPVDEEIDIDEIATSTLVSSPQPQLTTEEAGVEEDEDVDIGNATTPIIHDEYWEQLHPNSPVTTPLTKEPISPSVTEEIQYGSEENRSPLQTIPEESIPAASAEERAAPATPEVSVPSTDTETVPPATAEEIAKADLATEKNDSVGSPRPVLDVRPHKINLQPKPVIPKVGKAGGRPKFIKTNFFREKNFFIGESPYDRARIRRQRFWTVPQINYYSSLLFEKNKVFPHRHIPHVDMETIHCFTPVLGLLYDAGVLAFCSDVCDWNEELIIQFYATIHLSGDASDYSTWAIDWMTENTHFKAPASELLRALPLPIPQERAQKLYDQPELPDHLMQLLMKPLPEGEDPPTKFLVKNLSYVPQTIYRILAKSLSPIKGHNSENEEVVGIMKNLLYNIVHGISFDAHDFFMRTLANAAQSPFDLKPYAPWIMRFIRTRSSIRYQADRQNHLSFLPPVEILQETITSIPGKGKSVVAEGIRPLDGQFRQPASQSTGDENTSQNTGANASTKAPTEAAPRVMTDRELLISLHQKVDKNHAWVQRQIHAILHYMTVTQNAVKKNHYYAHETFDRAWAILSHLKTDDELKDLGFQQDFDWSIPPKKKFKKCPMPQLEPDSYSSSRDTDEAEEVDDTATGPASTRDPNNNGAPPSS